MEKNPIIAPEFSSKKTEDLENEVKEAVMAIKESSDRIDSQVEETLAALPENLSQEQLARIKTIQEKAESIVLEFKDLMQVYLKRVVLTGLLLVTGATDMATHYKNQTLSEKIKRAKLELKTNGITTEQKKTYKPIVSEGFQRSITPFAYGTSHVKEILPNLIWGKSEARYRKWKTGEELEQSIKSWEEKNGPREDAWRLYLGLPQEKGTFDISDYKPQRSKDSVYYYSIKNFWQNYLGVNEAQQEIKWLYEQSENGVVRMRSGDDAKGAGQQRGIMGNYTISFGRDEKGYYISYYDLWDLAVPLEEEGLIGQPFEIYDRLYYDPVTFEPTWQG